MYTHKKQKRAGPGMHGWPPDSATQASSISHDSVRDQHRSSFTHGHCHPAPQCPPKERPNHTLQNHGRSSLCSTLQNNTPHHNHWSENHNPTMNNNNGDIFDEWLLNDAETDPQLIWPLTSTPEPLHHHPPDFEQPSIGIAAQTLTNLPSTIQGPFVLPNTQASDAAKIKPAPSKSLSHVSTPELTPPTPTGSWSTPETSVECPGDAGDARNALAKLGTQDVSAQQLKTILPAALGHGYRTTRQQQWNPCMDFRFEIPGNCSTDESQVPTNFFDLHSGVSKSRPICNNNNKVVDPTTENLDWRPDSADLFGTSSCDALNKIFDLHDVGNSHIQQSSPYPPLPHMSGSTNDLSAEPLDPRSLPAYSDPFLTVHPWEFDMANEDVGSHACIGMLSNGEIPAQDVPLQSVEHAGASLVAGEGSRRDTSRDAELLALRESGLSYREIKQKHGFKEAESTLRGRCRTLLKPKEYRVRKPVWDEYSVNALCTLVLENARQQGLCLDSRRYRDVSVLTSSHTLSKIAWKKVAIEMHDRYSTYPYGNAPIKKKYLSILRGEH